MEGGDPTGVIINHLGSKTFQIARRGGGARKKGKRKDQKAFEEGYLRI
jgi:hypothetical protein